MMASSVGARKRLSQTNRSVPGLVERNPRPSPSTVSVPARAKDVAATPVPDELASSGLP